MIAALRGRLHRRRHPQRYAHLERLLAAQTLSREALLARQRQELADITAFAAAHTRYYGETLAPVLGDVPFDALPILGKDDVIRHLDDLLADTADRSAAKIGHTGGSTGKPLAFWYDEAKHELMRAGMMRSYMLSGWRVGQKIVNLWGARQDVAAGGVFASQLADFAAAEHTISAFEYSEAKLVEWARFIQSYRPVLLQGYASVLADLARVVIEQRLAMPASLVGVYSTAEVLDDSQRALMQQAFGCKVYNQYGSREIPNIACECREGSMHVFTDMVHLESLRTGDENRLLVTSLTNRLMPMIRYDIGDAGRLIDGSCACGLPFPLMEMDMCRQNDQIRTRSGKTVHPAYFNRLLYGQTQLREYQWVQRDFERIVLNVVAPHPLGDEFRATLQTSIRRDVDPRLALEVNYLSEIPRTVSGKHRYVIGLDARNGAAASEQGAVRRR
jgi:phenylacetate-CoA ligase